LWYGRKLFHLQKDFYRESGKWLSPFQIWTKCINPNLHFIYVLRKAQQYQKTSVLGFFWKLVLRHYQIKYGFQIYPETEIGEGFIWDIGEVWSLIPKLKSVKTAILHKA
jgi:serine O-acetyltransferase